MSPPSLYLTCPAYAMYGPVDRQKNIDLANWLCARMGWTLTVSPLMSRYMGKGSYLPANIRIEDFREALRHEVIWACRGGFGSIEIVDAILKAKVKHAPRLIGYSDITALHAAFQVRGWTDNVYSAAPEILRRGGRAGTTLLDSLSGGKLSLSHNEQASAVVLRAGRAQGKLYPACLSVLSSLCGTPAMPSLRGCVLAIEDVKIHPFLMATHLQQLSLCGALRGVRGLLGGSFTFVPDHDYLGPSQNDILHQWGERLRVPTIARLPFGHMNDPMAMPYDRPTQIVATKTGEWSITIAAQRKK
jgi:muramoyltetrapeptide carboxypeptidase